MSAQQKTFYFLAEVESGDQHEEKIEGWDLMTAAVEAKQGIERWLAEIGQDPSRLTRFDHTHTTP